MASRHPDVIRCKNIDCDTDYNKKSFEVCPGCGTPWLAKKDKNDIPELREYEKRTAELMPAQAASTKKEGKMGLLSVWTKKKELELELKKLSQDLDHHKRQEEMRIAEAVQKQRLISNEEVANIKIETQAQIKEKEANHQLAVIQLKGAHEKQLSELQIAHAKAMAELEAKYSKEHYNKLSEAMVDLHQHGDKNSQFIQNLALEMVKKTPKMLPTQAEVHVSGDLKDLEELKG